MDYTLLTTFSIGGADGEMESTISSLGKSDSSLTGNRSHHIRAHGPREKSIKQSQKYIIPVKDKKKKHPLLDAARSWRDFPLQPIVAWLFQRIGVAAGIPSLTARCGTAAF